jgi:hypothetical protein
MCGIIGPLFFVYRKLIRKGKTHGGTNEQGEKYEKITKNSRRVGSEGGGEGKTDDVGARNHARLFTLSIRLPEVLRAAG